MKVSTYVIEFLKKQNVDKAFGVSGGVINNLIHEIGNHQNFEAFHCCSENQAVFMAQSYGYQTDSFGVVFCIWGAGQSNMINGISSAFMENKKLLIITGTDSFENFSKYPAQNSTENGVDFMKVLDNMTTYNKIINDKKQVIDSLNQAVYQMELFSKPVHIQISKDILNEEIVVTKEIKLIKNEENRISSSNMDFLKNIIKNKKVNFIIGKNCIDVTESIQKICLKYQQSICTTPSGKGLVSERHPNFIGNFGIATEFDEKTFNNFDYNIFIGDALSEENTGGWSDSLINQKMIYINNIIHENRIPFDILKNINCGLKETFDELEYNLDCHNVILNDYGYKKRKIKEKNGEKVNPKDLITFFSNISDNSVSYFDIGNSFLWGIRYWKNYYNIKEKEHNFKIGTGFGTMGWALGTSIGHAISNPNKKIFCFIGDGSILMCSQEIAMLQNLQLSIVFVILNDSQLGTIYHGQKMLKSNSLTNSLPVIDFSKMYQSMGIDSIKVKSIKDLEKNKKHILKTKAPLVIDVHINKEAPPPLDSRIKNLINGAYK